MEFHVDLWIRAGAGYVVEGGEGVINAEGFRAAPLSFDGYTQRYTFVRSDGRHCSIHRTYVSKVRKNS